MAAAVTGATTAAAATVHAVESKKMAVLLQIVDIWNASVSTAQILWTGRHPYDKQARLLQKTEPQRYFMLDNLLKEATAPEERHRLAAYALETLAPEHVSPEIIGLLVSCYKTEALSSALKIVSTKFSQDQPYKKLETLLAIVQVRPTDDNIAYLFGQVHETLDSQSGAIFSFICDTAPKLLKMVDKAKVIGIAKQLLQVLAKGERQDKHSMDTLGEAIAQIVRCCPEVEVALLGLENLYDQLSKNKLNEKLENPRRLLPIIINVLHKDVIKQLSAIDQRLAPSCKMAQAVLDYKMGDKHTFTFNQADYLPQAPQSTVSALCELFIADLTNFFITKAKNTQQLEFLDAGLQAIHPTIQAGDSWIKSIGNKIAQTMIGMARADMLLASVSSTQAKT